MLFSLFIISISSAYNFRPPDIVRANLTVTRPRYVSSADHNMSAFMNGPRGFSGPLAGKCDPRFPDALPTFLIFRCSVEILACSVRARCSIALLSRASNSMSLSDQAAKSHDSCFLIFLQESLPNAMVVKRDRDRLTSRGPSNDAASRRLWCGP
jgi:hypothetical protein